MVAGGIILTVLAIEGLVAAADLASEPRRRQLAEPVARVVLARHSLSGTTRTPPGVPGVEPGPTRIPNLLRSVSAPAGVEGTTLLTLLHGQAGGDAPAWRSAGGHLPIDLRFATGEQVLAGRLLLATSPGTAETSWVQEVEIWMSPSQDDSALGFVGHWTLAHTADPQEFSFARRAVRTVRLRILRNDGNPDYTSLAVVALLPPATSR